MSLFILVQACCLKHTRPDISWTENTGSVIVFTRCPLMPVFCLVTAELNTAGVNSRVPSPPSLSLPEFSWHRHTSVTSPWSSPPRTFNNPRRTKKSALMAARFEKRPSAWKADPFKVMPGAESWTTRGIFKRFLHLSSVSERQRPNMQLEIQYVHLSYLFTVLLLSLKN